jgi:hypothetical protein
VNPMTAEVARLDVDDRIADCARAARRRRVVAARQRDRRAQHASRSVRRALTTATSAQ